MLRLRSRWLPSRWLPSLLGVVLTATLAASPLAAQSTTKQRLTAERALRQLEDDWAQAVVRRDAAAIRKLTTAGWVYTDESGTVDREKGIASFVTGSDTVRQAGNEEMRIHRYGNTAVVTGILRMSGRGPNGAFTHRYRYTDTWMKLDGRWQCIASQDYLIVGDRR